MTQRVRTFTLPIAMIAGAFAHDIAGYLVFLTPYLIFAMLLVTYCKLSLHSLHISPMYFWLVLLQTGVCWLFYALLALWDPAVAEGAFICIFCPTATSAPVVAAMLGGNLSVLVSYSLLSNMAVAILSPIYFSFIGAHTDMGFAQSCLTICQQVLPLLLLPLLTAVLLQRFLPRVHEAIRSKQSIAFYLWAVSLFIVVGKSVNFVLQQPASYIPEEIAMAAIALLCCVMQFYAGRKIGSVYGDKVSGAQGLGQKNTVLAIWMTLTYLHPIASVAPASYVVWQNIINSTQIALKDKKNKKQQTATIH